MFRNERKLYKRKCDFTGKDIISIYSPDKPYKVYDQSVRWSDEWGDVSSEVDVTLDNSLFSSISRVFESAPMMSLMVKMNDDCHYVNGT